MRFALHLQGLILAGLAVACLGGCALETITAPAGTATIGPAPAAEATPSPAIEPPAANTLDSVARAPQAAFTRFSKVKLFSVDPPSGGDPVEAAESRRRCGDLKRRLEIALAPRFEILPTETGPDGGTIIIRLTITQWRPAPRNDPQAGTSAGVSVSASDSSTGSILAEITDQFSAQNAEEITPAWAGLIAGVFLQTNP